MKLFHAETSLGPFNLSFICNEHYLYEVVINPTKEFYKNFCGEFRVTSSAEAAIQFVSDYLNCKKCTIPPLDLSGYTDAERAVYAELCNTSFGETITYGALAHRAGLPRAARFVGSVMRKNRLPVIIPCHRVVPASGGIGNYSGGIGVKKWLLDFESSETSL